MDWGFILNSIPQLLKGAGLTLMLFIPSMLLGLTLALPIALASDARNSWLRFPATGYMTFFRGTPLLVQLFVIYYGPGQFELIRESIWWPLLREAMFCAILALTLNTAAYSAYALRGAIRAIPKTEIEAGLALGLSPLAHYSRLIIPRALQLALPALGNEVITLLKGTSLVFVITIFELMGTAHRLYANSFLVYEPLLTAAVLYLLMTLLLTWLTKSIENALSYPGSSHRVSR